MGIILMFFAARRIWKGEPRNFWYWASIVYLTWQAIGLCIAFSQL